MAALSGTRSSGFMARTAWLPLLRLGSISNGRVLASTAEETFYTAGEMATQPGMSPVLARPDGDDQAPGEGRSPERRSGWVNTVSSRCALIATSVVIPGRLFNQVVDNEKSLRLEESMVMSSPSHLRLSPPGSSRSPLITEFALSGRSTHRRDVRHAVRPSGGNPSQTLARPLGTRTGVP
jgi:hypothetical protein